MIHMMCFLFVTAGKATGLKARELFFASEQRMVQVVGRRTSPPKEPGIRFAHPGYYEVWIDSPGPGMTHLRLGVGSLCTWQQYLKQLGLGFAHSKAEFRPVAPSPIPLYRHKLALTGVTGIPAGKGGKPWNVVFVEYAVANKDRARALKRQIRSLPVGEARNKLIRTCYDWWSELDFTAP